MVVLTTYLLESVDLYEIARCSDTAAPAPEQGTAQSSQATCHGWPFQTAEISGFARNSPIGHAWRPDAAETTEGLFEAPREALKRVRTRLKRHGRASKCPLKRRRSARGGQPGHPETTARTARRARPEQPAEMLAIQGEVAGGVRSFEDTIALETEGLDILDEIATPLTTGDNMVFGQCRLKLATRGTSKPTSAYQSPPFRFGMVSPIRGSIAPPVVSSGRGLHNLARIAPFIHPFLVFVHTFLAPCPPLSVASLFPWEFQQRLIDAASLTFSHGGLLSSLLPFYHRPIRP